MRRLTRQRQSHIEASPLPGQPGSGSLTALSVRDSIHQLLHRVIRFVHSLVASVAGALLAVGFQRVSHSVHRIPGRRITLPSSLCLLLVSSCDRSSTAVQAHVFDVNISVHRMEPNAPDILVEIVEHHDVTRTLTVWNVEHLARLSRSVHEVS